MDQTRPKVVLVDDNIATLNQGKALLKAFYKVYTVQSAATLFENLEHYIPDLILLDVEMPEMDGFETIKKLKADVRYKDIPVIFLTARSDEESEKEGFKLGAVDYIAKPFSGPLLQKRISNQILYIRVQSAIKDYANNLEVLVDELAKANERTRILLDKTPLCCQLWDSNFKKIDCNEAAIKLFSFRDKEDFLDRYSDLYPEFQPDGQRSDERSAIYVKKAFEDGACDFEWTYKMLDGTLMPAEVSLVRVEYEGDFAVAGYTRDLREQKAAIEEMRKAEIATESNKAKSMFLATMSHEIRTPMNSILGFAEMALDNDVDPEVRDYLNKITESTKWLLSIVNDILDISKIESGKLEIEHEPFDLHDVFLQCQSVILPSAKNKGLNLDFYLEPIKEKKLLGDPVRLYQALINLLSNAVKFTNTGTVKLSSTIKESSDRYTTVYFEVKDTGIGMSSEHTEKIYESFTQIDSSTTRSYGGSGLGLAITKNIVEMMGGRLAVESSLGAGTTFSFEITFQTVDANLDTNGQKKPGEIAHDGQSHKKSSVIKKPKFDGLVLVCDDNLMNQEVICKHLARVGLQVVVAENGKIGVEKVEEQIQKREKPFDLILMDIFMPIMDGMEAASKITALDAKIPIVAMTANVMAGELEKYTENGMPDCLGKPFTSQELWSILLKYLTPVSADLIDENEWKKESDERQQKMRLYFIKNNQTRYKILSDAIAAGDIKQAHRIAHSLKDNAAHIGKTELQKAAASVEALLKNETAPILGDSMNILKTEFMSVIEELKPLLDESAARKSPPPLDAERKKALFEKLEPMLINLNPESVDLLDDLSAVPGAEELARQIEDYDFESALRTLTRLRNS